MSAGRDLWVFGYGSLIWRPGFDFVERHAAVVRGYHRALCVYSHVHRGTRDRPGLVLGLDRGGSCKGVAFRVAAAKAGAALAYLREREQVTAVYREVFLRARLACDGQNRTSPSVTSPTGATTNMPGASIAPNSCGWSAWGLASRGTFPTMCAIRMPISPPSPYAT